MARGNAPIGFTCPQIDAVIEMLAAVADRISDVASKLEECTIYASIDELEAQAANLRGLFNGRRSDIEEIRSNNEALRKFGEEQYAEAESLKAEVKALESQVYELESR